MVLPIIIIISCLYMLVPGGRIKEEIKALNALAEVIKSIFVYVVEVLFSFILSYNITVFEEG